MRTMLFGTTLVTAFLYSVTPAAAQCCGGAATPGDHAAHAAAAPAAPGCCGDHAMTAAPAAPAGCCGDHAAMAAPAGHAMDRARKGDCCGDHAMAAAKPAGCCGTGALPADDPLIALAGLGLTPAPAVKYLAVTFRDPVRVGQAVLLGEYLIEHDDDRMARGEPCTYIYAAADRRLPVATFHCEHLERPVTPTGTVVLSPSVYPSIKQLKEFQFGGESAAHGVPAVR